MTAHRSNNLSRSLRSNDFSRSAPEATEVATTKDSIQRAHTPIIIGLTGNIGVGKSTVTGMLAELGAFIIDADRVAHQVMEPGQPAYTEIVAVFGPEIAPNGAPVDRFRLGQIVFAEPEALQRLEQIVHPAVLRRIKELLAAATARVVVIEAIKLLEAGLSLQLCDQVWVVTAPREQQIERLMASRGLSYDAAVLRIDAQPPQAAKIAQAEVVIDNSGAVEATRAQVAQAWAQTVEAR
jgi:dephospho-CoA kinase